MANSNIGPVQAPTREKASKSDDFDLSRSHETVPVDLPHLYGFLLMFNSNIGPNLVPLRDIRLQNPSELDFDFTKSLKVKCYGVIGLTIYDILLMFNSNIGPNYGPL